MEASTPPTENKQQQETKWFVLRVVSGKERKVKEYLDKEISRGGWSEVVKQVFLPVEKVYKVQNGKKVMRERNYYPGYVMIEVLEGKLNDDLRDTIKPVLERRRLKVGIEQCTRSTCGPACSISSFVRSAAGP